MKLLGLLITFSLLSFGLFGQTETDSVEHFPQAQKYVEQLAEFPGGQTALTKYLAENIVYPENAIKNNIEGTVYIRFIISNKGIISNIRIVQGIPECYQCSEEVIKVYKKMPRWKPALLNGKKVTSYYNSKVNFKLENP